VALTPTNDQQLCVVCGHREPEQGLVCEPDIDTIQTRLRDVLRQMHLLPLLLIPGQPDRAERVTAARAHAPLPARLDALSLIGPGCLAPTGDVLAVHPMVRRWYTVQAVTVTTQVAGEPRTTEHRIVDWHCELLVDEHGQVVMSAEDDQVGSIPPAEWLDSWVRRWRTDLGHHRSPVRRAAADPEATAARGRRQRAAVRALLVSPTTGAAAGRVVARYLTLRAALAAAGPTVLGTAPAVWPRERRTEDPLREEWEVRFGEPARDEAAAADVGYLLDWLPAACERDLGMAEFAAQLRAVHAELTRVLGETPDQQWLGRCPATITTRDTGETRPCGGGLWQPRTDRLSQVKCPRCHATWGGARPVDKTHLDAGHPARPVELLDLARQIRQVWPVDRRRRYNAEHIGALRVPSCPGCGGRVRLSWAEVTEPGERRRWWRPTAATCHTDGCDQARRLM
jgi:hypothetical protein